MANGIRAGDKAPDFTLTAQSGEQVRLYDRLASKVVVLYFYQKDETSGCTAEACAFRDSHVRKSYGFPAILGLAPGRVTYVIDRTGTVRHTFNSMTNISQHVGAALKTVQRLRAAPPA